MLTHCNFKQIGILSPDEYNNPYIFDASGNVPTFITVGALDYLKKTPSLGLISLQTQM